MQPLIVTQAQSVLARLDYQRAFGVAHLSDFATYAMSTMLGTKSCSIDLSHEDLQTLGAVVDEQLQAEEQLPPGVRLMRFAHHPLRVVIDQQRQRTFQVPISEGQLLEWLRKITGWSNTLDAIVGSAIGVSLPFLAAKLASQAKSDPAMFFALICFKFDHPSIDFGILCKPVTRRRGERAQRFHKPPSLAGNMIRVAEWARAIEIARYHDARRSADADSLMAFLLGRPSDDRNLDRFLDLIRKPSPLAVPSLFVFLGDHSATYEHQLKEFHRVLSGEPRPGPKSTRPIYHYYGLGPEDMLAVAFLDLVRAARGIAPNSPAVGIHKPAKRQSEDFGDDPLSTVIEVSMAECGMSCSLKQDSALKARSLRDRYARDYPVYGSACRFDPRFWLMPTRDALLFERLTNYPAPDFREPESIPDKFLPTTALVRDILRALLKIPMNIAEVPIGAEVVAHLMSSATEPTRDPALLALLEHSMAVSGYCARRVKKEQLPSPALSKKAGRWFGCHLPPYQLSKRRHPDLPWAGIDASFPRSAT